MEPDAPPPPPPVPLFGCWLAGMVAFLLGIVIATIAGWR